MSIEIPEAFDFLFEPARYHVVYGGRGSGKSVNVAKCLLIRGAQKKHRILCCRELQASIRDSVHKLLADEIDAMGLQDFYEVQKAGIYGKNGTEILFKGLRHSVSEVKSTQGISLAWCEEAQVISKASWDVLIPTVREEGSEFYITFNPELDTDETYVRFVKSPPPGALVRKVNWQENPWFPDVLRDEKDHLKERDPDAYLTVWEGHTRQVLDGAIYAHEMRDTTEQGRITKVPYDQNKPVHTFWDLGRSDRTSIWFAQIVGFEFRILDFYEASGYALPHYLKVLQGKPYVYGTMWLPHDATHELLASERTIEQQARAAGFTVRITPKVGVVDGINAARTIFPTCWFDEDRCADGLNALRRYRYDVDVDTGQRSKNPLHDENSHAADAWRYLAVALREPKKTSTVPVYTHKPMPPATRGAWLR